MISVGSRDGRKMLELGLEMEEAEHEEGEARGYGDGDGNGDGDSTVDPDIALSYIGDKLQKYLGHLQKDFEGGVSAENLGAKYGGYGSFLPTYQRSPSSSQMKSLAEVHNYNLPKSPRKLNLEDQRQKPFDSSSARSDASGKAVTVGHSLKDKGDLQSDHIEEPLLRTEAIKKSLNPSDQRTLKVRIKVGSENLSTRKNAELYNGLGLVFSPSSSLDDSPRTNIGMCGKRLHVPDESPTSILEIMTAYPGEPHLSPLPKGLINLTEKRKLAVKSENKQVYKMGLESSGMLENDVHSSKSNQKVLELKKSKLYGKDDSFSSQKNNGDKDNSGSVLKEKEFEINASGHSFLLSSQRSIGDSAKDVPTATMPASNVSDSSEAFRQEDAPEAENSHDLNHLQSNASGCTKPSKQLLKGGPANEGLKPALEKSSANGKRRQKVVNTVGTQGVCKEKDESMVNSSLPQKGGRSWPTNGAASKNESHKPGDKYKDIFGDAEFENDDNEPISREMASAGRLKEPHIFEKRSLSEYHNTSKKDTEAPTRAGHRVDECWVSCDKCKKRRLLPHGTNPASFPRKWVCRMLNWLPGMNRCSVPEDETTNALRTACNPAATATSASILPVDVQTAAIDGKKANSADLDGPVHSSNSGKRILSTSEKISNGNCENHSPLRACGDQHVQTQLSAIPKHNDADEEKISPINHFGKDANLKARNKREPDVERSRASKRVKSEELHVDDENWNSANGGSFSKADCGSTSLSNNNTLGNDKRKYIDDKDMSGEAKKSTVSRSNAEKHAPGTSDDDLLHSGKYDEESVRKRKAKEPSDSLIHAETASSSGRCHRGSGDDELLHRKEKKARVSKSGGKDQSGSKSSRAVDCLVSDMVTEQPLVGANSSSSKVTSAQKNKNSGQEIKGSPADSVCSSPLKVPNTVKVTSTGKTLNGKSNFHESGFTTVDSPRRISGDKDDGRNERMGTDGNDDKNCSAKQSSEKCRVDEKSRTDHSKDKDWTAGSATDKADIKVSDLHDENLNGRRSKSDEKSSNPSKGEKFVSQKDTARGQGQKKFGHDRNEAENSRDKNRNLEQEHDNEKLPTKGNHADVYAIGKSNSLPPLARAVDGCEDGETQKAQNPRKRAENPSSHPTPNSHKVRDGEASSPLQRESSSHAASSALREAKDLKHMGDRLKNAQPTESIGLYFQAVLKFLHGASLLESGSNKPQNELMQSIHIYSTTAKLCEFCAREYEKSKDMEAAALAYKCMEVAYMRVVYSSHTNASRDRTELSNALQIVPSGESPSSSASDIDNLNHQATTDKSTLAKAIGGSPQVSGSLVITSGNYPGFKRLLTFAQYVNFAMEASRKSRIALTAATSRLGETSHNNAGICSLKKALDFNFQDVESLLRLVRVAMEAIGR